MLQTLTGEDTLTLWNRSFVDLADDTVSDITFPDELVTVKTGKNKNTIFAKNEQGNNAVLVLRVMRGSNDDKFLNSKIAALDNSDVFPTFVLGNGTFVKRLGDGLGNVTNDTYNLTSGIFTKKVEVQENVSGDTTQAVSIYNIKFALGTRSMA